MKDTDKQKIYNLIKGGLTSLTPIDDILELVGWKYPSEEALHYFWIVMEEIMDERRTQFKDYSWVSKLDEDLESENPKYGIVIPIASSGLKIQILWERETLTKSEDIFSLKIENLK